MNLVGDETLSWGLADASASAAAEVVGRVAGVLAGAPAPCAPLGGATRVLEEAKVR